MKDEVMMDEPKSHLTTDRHWETIQNCAYSIYMVATSEMDNRMSEIAAQRLLSHISDVLFYTEQRMRNEEHDKENNVVKMDH